MILRFLILATALPSSKRDIKKKEQHNSDLLAEHNSCVAAMEKACKSVQGEDQATSKY
jgi:hypothetical protein